MLNLSNYKFIIFDCDGVILDSNNIKVEAFKFALKNFEKQKIDLFIEYHKKNGGISRYEKFKFFFRELIKIKKSEFKNVFDKATNDFSFYLKKNYKLAKLTPGVISFIKLAKFNKLKLYVVSGSDQNELIKLFKKKKLEFYFNLIL